MHIGLAPISPEDSYVQVLGSESSYYGPVRSRPCSEYSCYSMAAAAAAVAAGINQQQHQSANNPRPQLTTSSSSSMPSTSDFGSFAVYDSDNCSVGYYYHNSGLMQQQQQQSSRCLHVQQNLKHFGDTLTPCHGAFPPEQTAVRMSTACLPLSQMQPSQNSTNVATITRSQFS